ncbi:MAG: Em GEA1 (EM1) [Deltaproteobacteria bacterium]|nr:Em GEA1 (EM1) [Deltaproteobacteria bacterium]
MEKVKAGKKRKGAMTVAEAGRKGGLRVRDERGLGYYEEIGRMGGLKVRALIEAGRRALAQAGKRGKKGRK